MYSDFVKATGRVHVRSWNQATGETTEERKVENLVVQVGKNYLARRAANATDAVMSEMAIGAGTVATASTDTTLGSELARVALTSTTVVGNVITFEATFPAGVGTGPVTEAGIFNDPTAGIMLARTVFGVVNKPAADATTIIWNITIS